MRRSKIVLLGLFLVAAVASGLWATKAINPEIAEQVFESSVASGSADQALAGMAQQSDAILTGQCTDIRSVWTDSRTLATFATISVGETLKGAPAATITVVLPGGIDANRKFPIAMTYPGAPQIAPGEDVFLFLMRDDSVSEGYAVTGLAQGKYSIVDDESGQKMVSPNMTKGKVKSGPGAVRGPSVVTPLSEFKQKVRDYLQ
jgi:hypothetical protein